MLARKRQVSETLAARRRSGRIGSSAKKSNYFETSDDSHYDDGHKAKKLKTAKNGRKPGERRAVLQKHDDDDDDFGDENYGDEDEDVNGDEVESAQEDDDSQDDKPPKLAKPAKRSRGRPPKAKPKARTQDSSDEVAEQDVNGDDDDSDAPKRTFIPLPQMRDDGGVEYEDEKLHKNTLLFLKDLKANNKRTWLKSHDEEYRRSWKDWEAFVSTLTDRISQEDFTVPELPLKDIIFRIYRDIRFSKDPTPYKPHYSAAWSRTGRKGPYACYYVHCEPGGASFVGGGLWHPDAGAVHKLRASIDERPRRWRRTLMDPAFRSAFLPEAGADEKSVLEAFAEANKGNALKTKPKGFIAEHRDIELLKLRNFTIGRMLPDGVFISDDAQDQIMESIRAMVPFITFLNSVVMPDPNVDDNDDDEDED